MMTFSSNFGFHKLYWRAFDTVFDLSLSFLFALDSFVGFGVGCVSWSFLQKLQGKRFLACSGLH
jgi:hypothetical protein